MADDRRWRRRSIRILSHHWVICSCTLLMVSAMKIKSDWPLTPAAPPSARTAIHTALLAEASSAPLQKATASEPSIQSALPVTSPIRRPIALSNPSLNADGTGEHTLPLDDRPWEMFELLDPPPRQLTPSERFLATKPLKDTASVPLSHFSPKLKRDALPDAREPGFVRGGTEVEIPDDPTYWDDFASERNLGDGLAGEPMAVRQMASALYKSGEEKKPGYKGNNIGTGAASEGDSVNASGVVRGSTPKEGVASPTAAVTTQNHVPARRMSSRSKTSQQGSNHDPISIDSDDSDSDNSDDSAIMPIPPPPKRARAGSKTTATTAGAGQVGGKTTRKTTGGKSVGGKSSRGGKSVRGMSGKVPRVGRR